MLKLSLFILLSFYSILSSQFVSAESKTATGIYKTDLGQLNGAINSTQRTMHVCDIHYPEYSIQSTEAYVLWKKRNKSTIQEINRHRIDFIYDEADGNPEIIALIRMELAKNDKMNREALERVMLKQGDERFRKLCQHLPVFLKSERSNLIPFYKDQLETIRQNR